MSDFTVADVLDEARELIERGWCRIGYAEDADGNRLADECMPEAVRWCATGAISRASRPHGYAMWRAATEALAETVGRWGTAWNDHPDRTQAEVVEAFRRTAARLRGHGGDTWTKADAYLADIEQVSA